MGRKTQLSQHEQWFAEGAAVVELTYHGRDLYSAAATTVTRVTPHQIITATGRRFWRARCGRALVGLTDRRNGGQRIDLTRIVPRDNVHAVRVLGAATGRAFQYRNFEVLEITEQREGAAYHGWQASCPVSGCPREIRAAWPSLMRSEITQHVLDHQRQGQWPFRRVT